MQEGRNPNGTTGGQELKSVRVKLLGEAGYAAAMLGLSLSYNQPMEKMPEVARRLVLKGGSHAKFLESMVVWFLIKAPRYWWQQFDTFRVGVTKQSESTMHTIMKRSLTSEDFVHSVPPAAICVLNDYIENGEFEVAKASLPEGFLQERVVCLNYKALAHMYQQRKNHRLSEWQDFFDLSQLAHPQYVRSYGEA